jgi:2-haloacid dehalogenase
MKLSTFRVLTFDCYGTLIDWETGIVEGLHPLTAKLTPAKPRDKVLETFAEHESAQQELTPTMAYSVLLSVVYRRLAQEWQLPVTNEEANIFGASIPDWPEFGDSVDALRYLKQHFKLVILSNVDRISFRSSNKRLGVEFDAVYTAQDIESYKPSSRNFEYLLRRVKADFGLDQSAILHTAQSLFHDHVPANNFGLASAWIDRRHDADGWGATSPPAGTPKFDFRFNTMAELVAAHRKEIGTTR